MRHKVTIEKIKKLQLAMSMSVLFTTPVFGVITESIPTYEFNTGFIVGSKENINLMRFNKSSIDEGKYSVDVYMNNSWKGRFELNITKQNNGQLGICYTANMLTEFGVATEKLNKTLSKDASFCGTLAQWNKDENVKDDFNSSTLSLMISMPQIYELANAKGLVSSKFWDTGVPAINLSYMSNYYDNHFSENGEQNNQNAYLGLNASVSVAGWQLKHLGNLTWDSIEKTKWNSNQTYLKRAIPDIKSNIMIGQFYTEGNLFDSIKLKGVKLATSDNMYPDGSTSYSPEIRGIALSNALVTVRQDGNIIYQTSVAPGPFNFNDVYPSGYGSDLDVTVKEADGSETHFSVPYASIAQLLRPGFTHYQIAAGKADIDSIKNKPNLLQATIQHGLNNTFTLYSGATIFDDYQAYFIGSGINTGFGALALDIIEARTSFKNSTENGRNYRLSFNKQFDQTQTGLLISTSHSPNRHYYNANEALHFIDYEKQNRSYHRSPQKNDLSITINQNFGEGYGSFYLTGRTTSYWGNSNNTKQFQQTYNNYIGRLSYSLSYMRVYSQYNNKEKTDNQFSLNFSLPFDFFGTQSTLSSNTTFNNSNFGSTRLGLNGTFDKENRATYGINTAITRGGNQNIALNTNYRSSISAINANYSQGENYRQFGLGASGSVVLHQDGVTFTPNTSDTLVLIEAKGAKGAAIPGSSGVRVDDNGYAIASYVRPFRANTIDIDPKGSPEDIIFSSTSAQIAPYEGSVTKVKFDTKIEKNNVFNVTRSDAKPLPFGANVITSDNHSIGIVGQGGQVFITNDISDEAIVTWESGQCRFSLKDSDIKDKVCI
ncbi:fimbria/pilus outer membrane usher protein [Orbus wheelerorum]|uniref:fimbria/pilus outer membrane usher protein n=1 Tax=Orbus wheelerorum TaxID=3074111 RepID=UPI00370D62C6